MTLQDQINAQERLILELRAENGNLRARCSQQQLIIDRQQRFIERLQDNKAKAEAMFKNG